MLTPKEKPYLQGLNSYYLDLERFTEHMQGEIGSGCIYCKSISVEILIYFDESEIVRSVLQDKGQQAHFSSSLEMVEAAFSQGSFKVQVYFLDHHAIFFWGQMPTFQRAKSVLKSSEIPLPDLIFRLNQKNFSGFIDVEVINKPDSGILFFSEGKRVGGSYSWSKGGMSPSDSEYNTLLGRVQAGEGLFSFGSFILEQKGEESRASGTQQSVIEKETVEPKVQNPVYSELRPALEEFLFFFIQTIRQQINQDPLALLSDRILERSSEFSYLDPENNLFEYRNGVVKFSSDAPTEKIAHAFILCIWDVIRNNNAEEAFKFELQKMRNKQLLQALNIAVDG